MFSIYQIISLTYHLTFSFSIRLVNAVNPLVNWSSLSNPVCNVMFLFWYVLRLMHESICGSLPE